MPAAEYTRAFITSVVVGKDVVPRIGLHQMEAMRADLINAIQRSRDPKVNIMLCTSIVWLHFMFFVLKIRLSYIWYGVNFISLNYMRQLYIYLLVRVYQRHIFDGKIFPFFYLETFGSFKFMTKLKTKHFQTSRRRCLLQFHYVTG